MSSAVLTVHFAYADATAKSYAVGSDALNTFKTRLQNFNSIDETSQKKFTNLENFLCSDSGAALTGIKTASVTVSQSTRIFDAATYQP